jgi:hypothetical protein
MEKKYYKYGTRSIIEVKKKNTLPFMIINDNGVIKFLDGQIGKRAKLVYDYYQFLPTN